MRNRGVFLGVLGTAGFIGFIIQILWRGSSIVDSHPAALETTSTPTSPPTSPVIGPQSEELTNLLKMIEWPLAPTNVSLEFSTYPKTSEYFIINPRATYMIGESLEVLIIAKDHKGRTKNYGGDYFHVKLHSLSLKAGVSGSVTDHNNGSYTARFILQWSGETMISVRLMHSSELIAILHQQRDTRPDKVFFKGYFEKNGIREVVECNFDLPGQDVCEYYDRQNQEKWVCQRPKNLPCDSYRDHSSGGNRKIQSEEEKPFFSMSLIDQEIPSNLGSLNVLPLKNVTNGTNVACIAGLKNPNPSGFYYQDVWKSLVCSNKHFDNHTMATKCLAGKMVYMFGDSTMRQWWEYLVDFIPTLKQINLHVIHHNPGPLLATDAEFNYLVQWRAHQKPLRMERSGIQELRYISSELDRLGNRKGMIIVITCWSHFLTYPVGVYIHRLHHIREAVVRLLERSPETTILIKSANTGYRFDHGSDWLSVQLDILMRAMFSKLPVTVLDVWQMTSCHREPENLHPIKVIIKNEVDLMLSFICPH
ncbi:NXPE family member 3-like isoform X2 [Rana temporaria]|uniref:NXPE family member 3-like isoform X2 n=1 Tax=Rana temporaria TaxID=8407 RepID=UPI001AAC6681|nr:NXPE family member 3-like isoform X2 [Rana temporaria]